MIIRVEELRDSTAHAEMICIREASNQLRSWRLAVNFSLANLKPTNWLFGICYFLDYEGFDLEGHDTVRDTRAVSDVCRSDTSSKSQHSSLGGSQYSSWCRRKLDQVIHFFIIFFNLNWRKLHSLHKMRR